MVTKNEKYMIGGAIVIIGAGAVAYMMMKNGGAGPIGNGGGGQPLHIITESQLDSTINGKGMVFLEISGESCPHCREVEAAIRSFQSKYPDINFAEIDSAIPSVSNKYQVNSIPQNYLYKDGVIVGHITGYISNLEDVMCQYFGIAKR